MRIMISNWLVAKTGIVYSLFYLETIVLVTTLVLLAWYLKRSQKDLTTKKKK